jgi:hypothetical protein
MLFPLEPPPPTHKTRQLANTLTKIENKEVTNGKKVRISSQVFKAQKYLNSLQKKVHHHQRSRSHVNSFGNSNCLEE